MPMMIYCHWHFFLRRCVYSVRPIYCRARAKVCHGLRSFSPLFEDSSSHSSSPRCLVVGAQWPKSAGTLSRFLALLLPRLDGLHDQVSAERAERGACDGAVVEAAASAAMLERQSEVRKITVLCFLPYSSPFSLRIANSGPYLFSSASAALPMWQGDSVHSRDCEHVLDVY